jgi:hypothetical protein
MKKKIIFVLRDYNESKHCSLMQYREIINESLVTIWQKIDKPEKVKNCGFGEIFEIELVALPHFDYKVLEFKSCVEELRQRFTEKAQPSYVFTGTTNDILLSDIESYFERIWGLISTEIELNLPEAKKNLSLSRCDYFREELIKEFTLLVPKGIGEQIIEHLNAE